MPVILCQRNLHYLGYVLIFRRSYPYFTMNHTRAGTESYSRAPNSFTTNLCSWLYSKEIISHFMDEQIDGDLQRGHLMGQTLHSNEQQNGNSSSGSLISVVRVSPFTSFAFLCKWPTMKYFINPWQDIYFGDIIRPIVSLSCVIKAELGIYNCRIVFRLFISLKVKIFSPFCVIRELNAFQKRNGKGSIVQNLIL